MKKNKFMRLASALLVLTLLSTCAISGTFAKYTTTSSAKDNARVAYWGFNTAGTDLDLNLFSNTYSHNTNGVTVNAADGDNLVAPGTSGTATFSFVTAKDATNKPEVAYNFEVKVEGNIGLLLENELMFKLDGVKVGTNGKFTELKAAIAALSGAPAGTKRYEAGQLPEAFTNGASHTIEWEWLYEGGDDVADTTLGNVDYASLAELNLVITVTATQID